MTKFDISNFDDIQRLVDSFYQLALIDEKIGFIFQEHMTESLDAHLPTIYQFWESVLLKGGSYKGNTMLKHLQLHERVALEEAHFDRWFFLWEKTVDHLFEGAIAEEAKFRARTIKDLMLFKIQQINKKNEEA